MNTPGPTSLPPRDRQYYRWPRPDLLELVPAEARRVLDVGCGAGVFGEHLKRRQQCEVVGIDLDEAAAAEAAERLNRAICADVEQMDLSALGEFDTVVCGDVLEHLRDPARALSRLREALVPGGLLIASFPNVRQVDIVQQLVEGGWTYEPAGILDADHLRFFTRRTAELLVEEAGFTVTEVRGLPCAGFSGWDQAGRPGDIRIGRLHLSGFLPEEVEEFFVGQWLVCARSAAQQDFGLTSIVIVTWNELAYTQLCLESLRKHTHVPYELIVVDNGSTDGTREWLAGQSDVQLIANAANLGFAAAANQGLVAAQGPNLLLLNNDTVLTPGWLQRLLAHLHADAHVGAVGPVSNFVSGPQQILVPYHSLGELDGFAWRLAQRNRGQSRSTDRPVGFCLLLTRELLAQIGPLDERFAVGNFEDDDYCRRAREAGYELRIGQDVFVHHFGGRTFIGNQVPAARVFAENQRRFAEKWGAALSAASPVAPPPPGAAAPAPGAAAMPATSSAAVEPAVSPSRAGAARKDPTISLCMIVRDEADKIGACLDSARPYFDEMVVVDTGSRDATAAIARARGATVLVQAWSDSFSAARNASLDAATGEWVFWMDADDLLSPESGQALRDCARRAPESLLGYVAQVHCPPGPGQEGEVVVDHVKLFRRRPELRFELRIHEQILPAIRRAGGEIARAPIHVVHANYDRTREGQQRKRERDRRLLALDLRECPEHPFVHFNIGMTAIHEKEYPRAIEHLRRSIELSAPTDSQVRKAYALLVRGLRASGQCEAALVACREGRLHYPEDHELLFEEALTCQEAGRLPEAERDLRALLALPVRSDYLASTDTGISSCKARHNLGMVLQEGGKPAAAEEAWRQVISEHPTFRPSWLALGELLLAPGREQELAQLARRAQRVDGVTGALLLGRSALAAGHPEEAEPHLRAALARLPGLMEASRLLSHALLQQGERQEVEQVLRRLLEAAPDDGEACHNLGSLLLEFGRPTEAVGYLEQALRLRPGYRATEEALRTARARASSSGETAADDPSEPS